MIRRVACLVSVAFCFAGTALAEVAIVRDGQVRAVIVTAARPSRVAAYAAEELASHVEKAAGKRLPVVAEPNIPEGYESRIFVGVTDAALRQGIEPDRLEMEEFVLRSAGNDLYIVGKELAPAQLPQDLAGSPKEDLDNPLNLCCEYGGTLFGVYEVLDKYVGVRWLWPGELGTYVPRRSTIKIGNVSETVKPQMLVRWLGTWWVREMGLTGSWCGVQRPPSYTYLSEKIMRNLAFPTEEAGYVYGKSVETFIRRHRMMLPISRPVRVAQAAHMMAGVTDWWAAHGKEHPEWFAMRADGGRGMKNPRPMNYTAMCISNPELQRFIVEKAWNGGDELQMGEADVGGDDYCHCPNCEAWDGPQPANFPEIVKDYCTPRVVSDRYARFWKIIYDMAVKRNPNVKMSVFLYGNTLPAPQGEFKFSENVHGTFVVYGSWSGWYPMSAEEDQWYRDQWIGWSKTGMKLLNRSNYLLNSYTTPYLTTWQAGEFLKFNYDHGMIGLILESYNFAWAAQGPMAYMYHRLVDAPEMSIKDIRGEYFTAFGPAAGEVEKYFDYWENYARTRPPISSIASGDQYGAFEKLKRPRAHYMAYPPSLYPPAEAMLEKALAAASKDPLPEYAERVKFLQAGLKHAQISTRLFGLLDYDGPMAETGSAPVWPSPENTEKLKQARQTMQELIKFRRDPANQFVSDYMSNARVEKAFILNIEALFPSEAKPLSNALPDPIADWTFCVDANDRGLAEKWYEAVAAGDQWKPAKVPAFWPKAGADGYLLGYGWYRAKFKVPETWRGKPLHLHFGAVDEQAWVYVNGQLAGEHTVKSTGLPVDPLWEKPFMVEVPQSLLKYGGENLLVVRVHNSAYNGGIWKPVTAGFFTAEERAQLDE